ncbi:hypothetical protein KCP75_03175 [Salmonella enterica subsp. enterica]|nr:hypothetical protein KCP75_03175 [Salmonella enterica subsp. enterica]
MLPDKIYWAGRRDSARATRRTCFVASEVSPRLCAVLVRLRRPAILTSRLLTAPRSPDFVRVHDRRRRRAADGHSESAPL